MDYIRHAVNLGGCRCGAADTLRVAKLDAAYSARYQSQTFEMMGGMTSGAATTRTVQRGELVEGRYQLESVLGQGGMGTVWVARDLRLGRPVAIKFLDVDEANSAVQRARFAREARIASRVRNQHVVQVFGDGETSGGVPYVVMELLEGESLAARIARSCRCGLEETDAILQQVCRGLRSAHAQRLVHRDIKPGNIFLTPQPDGSVFVRVLDFGIAKEFDADQGLTLSGEIVGTGYYMSPEQLRTPQDVGAAADIWALGVVVYEMLTGCVPFDAASFPGLVVRIAEGKFRPPSRLHADLPPALDAYFKRALHVQPDRRFASVDDMSAAFSRILREHDLALKPEPRAHVEPTWQAPGRKRFADLTTDIVARRIRGPWRVALLVLGFGSWALVVRLGLAWLYAAPAAVEAVKAERVPPPVVSPAEPSREPALPEAPLVAEPPAIAAPEPVAEPAILRPAALAPPKRRRALPRPIAAAPVPASPSPLPAEERNYGF